MGFLDQLALRGPGVVAKGMAGQRAGEDRRRKQEIEDERRQRDIQTSALERLLLQENINTAPTRRRLLGAQASDEEAAAAGTGRYAPRPVPQPDPIRGVTETVVRGGRRKLILVDPTTGREIRELGDAPTPVSGSGSGGPKPRELPSGAGRGIADLRTLLDVTRSAKEAFGDLGDTNATGAFAGRIAGIAGQLGLSNPKADVARSRLANISTALGKLRSGGAITPQEYERLVDLIPNKNEDEEKVRTKLTELEGYLNTALDQQVTTYGETGYDVSRLQGGKPAPIQGGDADAEAAAFLARRRAKKP